MFTYRYLTVDQIKAHATKQGITLYEAAKQLEAAGQRSAAAPTVHVEGAQAGVAAAGEAFTYRDLLVQDVQAHADAHGDSFAVAVDALVKAGRPTTPTQRAGGARKVHPVGTPSPPWCLTWYLGVTDPQLVQASEDYWRGHEQVGWTDVEKKAADRYWRLEAAASHP